MPVSSRRFRYGIEHECALLRPDGAFADFTNTHVRRAAGHRRRACPRTRPTWRTCASATSASSASAGTSRATSASTSKARCCAATPRGWRSAPGSTRPSRRPWPPCAPTSSASTAEAAAARAGRHRDRVQPGALGVRRASPRSTRGSGRTGWTRPRSARRTCTWSPTGPTSTCPGRPGSARPDELVDAARKLTALSPYLVPLSFSSPFRDGGPWGGLSARTALRTGPRPAVLAFLADGRAAGARRPVADPAGAAAGRGGAPGVQGVRLLPGSRALRRAAQPADRAGAGHDPAAAPARPRTRRCTGTRPGSATADAALQAGRGGRPRRRGRGRRRPPGRPGPPRLAARPLRPRRVPGPRRCSRATRPATPSPASAARSARSARSARTCPSRPQPPFRQSRRGPRPRASRYRMARECNVRGRPFSGPERHIRRPKRTDSRVPPGGSRRRQL